MGSFNIKIDQAAKVFHAEVEGTFSPEDGMASIEAYGKAISTISVPEYEIDIDCTKLNVSAPETLPLLEGCFEMYKKDGFKKVTLRISKNPILKMQLGRVARGVKLDNYEIIEQ
ncbi:MULTISPECIES: hypothetical protein [Paenibacillus]|jgi:hypothetical protein|uniref:STAS domain-containing protein n=2 Tax=Paenibacillus lactis TaxID=228574 RepID=G4HHJ6_9BACL|nr:hypothetical protein [Paenibacillus lactis]EHB63572.1 hypothetical protein PaelaDRAFT_3457 [Paenibacillus lactis 154]MBP1891855.1 hypothetical protein [Paenibacillus lactis]MCM3494317.1 hypothetical protein [Paenibacillus lactis]GIO89098.1 hypothetical protein J31TS3_03250 [Paenibacillus lactis]HAF99299.1 hypothetical protein [Paenibacillus lactis]